MSNDLSSKLQMAMAKLGRQNGTAPQPSQDPIDKYMHYYFVDKMAESFFKKAAENSLKELIDECGEASAAEIDTQIKRTLKNDMGGSVVVATGSNYIFELTTRKPSYTFNKDKLRIELAKKGWTTAQIDELFERCSEKSQPAKSFKCVPT